MTDTTPWLDKQWMQRHLDALREAFDVPAARKKEMVEFLINEGFWNPKLSHDSAIARFNACLDPEKADKSFKFSEILALSKKFERYALLNSWLDDCGFERPRKKTTPERQQELLERIAASIDDMNQSVGYCTGELARLETTGGALRIHPAIRDGATFSLGAGEDPDGDASPIGAF